MAEKQALYRPCLVLDIKVVRGRNITLGTYSDWVDTPDPYVKLFIRTAPNGRKRTKAKNNTANPVWEETLKFYLDPNVKNILEITLMESDTFSDDLVDTKSFDLNELTIDETYKKTFVFKGTSEVDVEMKVKTCSAVTDMRYSLNLCDEETDFRQKRKRVVFEAMRKLLRERGPKEIGEVPSIAVLGSGGGFRAMVSLSGVFCALKEIGVLDCVMYTAGLSGSAWYLSTLYSHPEWPKAHPCEIKRDLRKNVKDNWMWLLLTPSWMYNHVNIILDKRSRGQPVSFTDFFGYLVGETILKDRKDVPKLSEQRYAVKDGAAPMPLYTCLHVKKNEVAQNFCEWLEFSPYEVGMAKYGTFMKTENFGSKYFCGKLVTPYPEPPLLYLQGIWGSALTIMLQRVLNEDQSPTDTVKNMSNSGDLRQELQTDVLNDPISEDEESDEEMDLGAMDEKDSKDEDSEDPGFLKSIAESFVEKISFLKTRSGRAGIVHNFLRGLKLMTTPVPSAEAKEVTDTADHLAVKAKRIYLVDSGLLFNSPYPPLLRPERDVDIFLSFDFSAREKDNELSFNELYLAEQWARENNLKFPPINAKEQLQKDGIKEYYVFTDLADPTCPVVVHFPLVNKTFKEQSKPGVPRTTAEEKKFANFSVFEDPDDYYSTFNFHYPTEPFDRLSAVTEFNTLLGKQAIMDVIADCVRKRRGR
ncbi:cytosolic phospholipase A2-like [Stylophora pistillata]|uniref:Phospholipase A2 n=1 Tax=Stylophora pistillata TaxID=50429 RepID=A0A2B4T1J1_STYPI|nr:cytosolic phospholipase A2-like [Stylophora pistillata]PFX34527.1 Cytosolic phospholipase A2 [Stylophora pistillata]